MRKEEILNALKELKKARGRKFNQTVDLIINLKDFDVRKNSVNVSTQIPYPVKKHKICAFLEKPSIIFDYVIAKTEFERLNDKFIKKIVKDYDFCVALAKLMPEIAKKFGRTLGPLGKMPDPKMGCVIMAENSDIMTKLLEKLRKTIRIRTKEKSIKIAIGKEDMEDEKIIENCITIYNAVVAALPKKHENIKNIMLKFTMSKPIKIVAKDKEKSKEKEGKEK